MALTSSFVLEGLASDSRVPRQLAAGAVNTDLLAAFDTTIGGWNRGTGVAHQDDYKVKQNGTPNMSVLVEGGYCFVKGKLSPFNQGLYGVANDGEVNLAISAADGTNPRHDLIILQVRDGTWGGDVGFNDQRLLVVTGTPAASPSDPSLASFNAYYVLARVVVPAAASSIVNANITDFRYSAGLRHIGLSSRRAAFSGLDASDAGLEWLETDTGIDWLWDGAAWTQTARAHEWEAWQPLTFSSADWSDWDAARACEFRKNVVGDIQVQGLARRNNTAAQTSSTNYIIGTLPVGYRPTAVRYFPAISNGGPTPILVGADGTISFTPVTDVWYGPSNGGYVGLDPIKFSTTT